jgi:4-hydroxybenzoyl-CoA thioesterase
MGSNHVQALEERLGARLLNRSTWKVSLTEVGKAYYNGAAQILADLEQADNFSSDLSRNRRRYRTSIARARGDPLPSFGSGAAQWFQTLNFRSEWMADKIKMPDFVTGEFFVNRRDIVVEWGHCDPAGIVFHPRFIEYFDWCCVLLLEKATGLSRAEMGNVYDFAGIPIVCLNTKFLGQVAYGDNVSIFSAVSGLKRSSFEVRHALVNQGKIAVECSQTRVWCGHDPENASRLKSRPIPAEVLAKLRTSNIAE